MNIFILTGAGISAESGLGTFRDKNGIVDPKITLGLGQVRSDEACDAAGLCARAA